MLSTQAVVYTTSESIAPQVVTSTNVLTGAPTTPNCLSTLLHEIGVVADVQPPRGSLTRSLVTLWYHGSSSVKHVHINCSVVSFMLAAFAFAYVLYLVILFGSIILYVFFNRTYR